MFGLRAFLCNMKLYAIVLGCAVAASMASPVDAVTPSNGEFSQCALWGETLTGSGDASQRPRILVAEEDVADAITRGRSWRGSVFQIGPRTYSHGIEFNANKRLKVILDRPAARFISDVGLENNDSTRDGARTGLGTVVFHVSVGGREVASTPVMRLTNAPVTLNVPLNGAKEFEIGVSDGGDGRGFDQALWGEALVELQDGKKMRLQDLPIGDVQDSNPARVSFVYDGKPGAALLTNWSRTVRDVGQTATSRTRDVEYRDPATGLQLTITVTDYTDFPAMEWVAHFTNTGAKDTPILESIRAVDAMLPIAASGQATLHWAKGGVASFDDFAPQTEGLRPDKPFVLSMADEGRSSGSILPFFNLEGAGGGVILGLGWSGCWESSFQWTGRDAVRVTAGMPVTHLILHPGEAIRTPRMLALFYEGDQWRGQNLLRQHILAHHRPQKDGKPLMPPITAGNWGGTLGSVHAQNIQDYISHKIPMEYYWIDAGWYGPSIEMRTEEWGSTVGNWNLRTNIYPQGFKALSDVLKKDGRELMVWFEPERVGKDTPWARDHKDWLMDVGHGQYLMNLGIPEARQFVTDFVNKSIREFGLGCYRQDYNIEPGIYWRKADEAAPNRKGIAEIRYIEGLYAFWDEVLARNPHVIIDNCASGGRRIDLETIGRATPFWRTDGPRDPIAHQCHTYGLMAWVPLSATSQDREGDDYEFRSSMCSSLCINWNHSGDGPMGPYPKDFPFDWARRTLEQYVGYRDYYLGDYHPLTSYTQAADQWMAYQLSQPDEGLIVVLRRPQSPFEAARFPLTDLDATAQYVVTNLDTGVQNRASGRELMEKGLAVVVNSKPGSALLQYKKQ
jgi:alpha-galactosidase